MNKKLQRTHGSEAMFLGVLGGFGKYFELDATLIRIIFAISTVLGVGSPIIVYLIMAVVMPKEGV